MSISSSVLAKMAVYLDANTTQFNSKLGEADKRLRQFAGAAAGAGIGISGIAGVQQLFGVLRDGISIISEFEAKMSEVRAITGATGSEFEALRDNALALSAASRFTASQIATLETEFGRLGFSTKEILQATKATIDLATATGEDLAKATVVVGSAVRQFNLPASQANHLADVMTGAFNKTALALDDFGESMKYVGPAAAAAGLTFEQTSALLGILADSGIKGSQAGTSLRRIITDLAKDSRPLEEHLRELSARGITLSNAFDDIGRIASTSLIVLEKGADRINPLTQEFINMHFEAERVSKIINDNLRGDIAKLGASYDKLIITTGNSSSGPLRGITQSLTDFLNALSSDKIDLATKLFSIVTLPGGGGKALSDYQHLIDQVEEKQVEAARKTFIEYSKGFKDTSTAAYNFAAVQTKVIYNLDLMREKFASRNQSPENDKAIATIDKRIERSRLLLSIAEQFKGGLPKDELTGKLVQNIPYLEGEISRLKDLQKANSLGPTVWEEYDKQIQALESRIMRIKGELKDLPSLLDSAYAPSDLTKGIEVKPLNRAKINSDFFSQDNVDEQKKALQDYIDKVKKLEDAHKGLKTSITSVNHELVYTTDALKQAKQVGINYQKLLEDLTTKTLVGFADALGAAFAGANTKDIGKTFLEGIVGFLHQFGELLIAAGVAQLALYQSLKGGPAGAVAAIAAGVALVAITSAISTSMKNQAAKSQSASQSGNRIETAGAQPVQVYGQTVLKGQDIYVALSNYSNNRNG